MKEETYFYQDGSLDCVGHIVYDDSNTKVRPAVMVAHAWYGQDDFARNKARELAKLGYIAFAIDMFGDKKNATNDEEAAGLITPLVSDREKLQKRALAALNTLQKLPLVDENRIGAIGFCFGGLTVVELLCSGAPLKSVVSFHGLFSKKGAKTTPILNDIQGSLLMLHGFDDPLSSEGEVLQIQKDLTQAEVNWQMNIYGKTSHAFTNPQANNHERGLIYNSVISERAWKEMKNYFEETL